MDRPPPTTTEPLYEPKERYGHAAVGVDGKVFLWGGWGDGLISGSVVEIFNMETGRWEQRKTTGTPPMGAEFGAYTTIGNNAYYFGGYDGSSHYNSLHSLDLSTMQWVTLQPRNQSQAPSRKRVCRMVAHGDDELVVFGGIIGDSSYTNELHVYNLREGTWSTPHVTGTPPPPCGSFSFTRYDDHHAVLFGGYVEGHGSVSDVYSLNMETWHWSKVDTHGESRPVERRDHTACLIGGPLMGSQHPQLLVIGGLDQSYTVLEDAWVLDLKTRTWRKVDLPHGVGPRCYHTATVVSCGPRSVMVVEFGGQRRFLGDPIAANAIVQIVSDSDQSRPGEPPTWRVVEVVSTDDPEKWRKKVDQLQKLGMVKALMKNKRKIPMRSASLVFFGPPLVGKSTTLQRILNDPSIVVPFINTTSTPVAEKPRRVIIKKPKPGMARLQGSKFKPQDFEQEKMQLARHSLREASTLQAEVQPEVQPEPQHEAEVESIVKQGQSSTGQYVSLPWWRRLFTRQRTPHPRSSISNPPGALPSATLAVANEGDKPLSSPEYIPPFQTPDDLIRDILSTGDQLLQQDEVQELLEGSTMLHILDTGGQPSFYDVLPMLLSGRTLQVLLFQLNEALEERYVVEYVSSDGTTTDPYVSSFTVEQVIFQALSSVSYTTPPASTLDLPLLPTDRSQSATILVGTYKDQVTDEKFEEIDNTLQKKLKCSSLPDNTIIRYQNPRGDQPPFNIVVPIDNTSPTDPGICLLQDLMNEVLEKRFDPFDTPLTWLMFHLSVRSTNAKVLSFQQCATIARQCGIEDDQELKLALWYLSHQCGIFRYYPEVKGLEDIVICDLQVLFDCVSNLISSTFFFGSACTEIEVRFRETGRCPLQHAEKLLKSCSEIPLMKLLNLLEHLRLLSPIHDDKGEVQEYFIPCILPSCQVETMQRPSSQCNQPAPLLITFESGYCPLGLFHSLNVHLTSLHVMKWRLCEGKLFRNKVSFHVGVDFDHVTLISRPTYYEIWLNRESECQNPEPLPIVCNKVRATIEQAIQTVKSSLNSTLQITHHSSFYCLRPDCHTVPHPATPENTPAKIAVCSFTGNPSHLSPQQRIWYGEEALEITVPRVEAYLPPDHGSVDDVQLGEDDLYDILAEVTDVTKWFDTGLALGLKYSTLEKIKIKNREDVDDCRRDMLVCWLRRMDRVVNQTGLPSWRSLVRALSGAVAYYPEIAEEIARKHPVL